MRRTRVHSPQLSRNTSKAHTGRSRPCAHPLSPHGPTSWLIALAEAKISHYAGALPASEILILASDACQLLGEDGLWFLSFTRVRIQQMFADSASLNKTGFLGCFESATPYSNPYFNQEDWDALLFPDLEKPKFSFSVDVPLFGCDIGEENQRDKCVYPDVGGLEVQVSMYLPGQEPSYVEL
ncbi:uncharacterized protein BCR38DRAFT_409133 [Pseudomassariella vexata]|uniref:Uncharacterized protein n=1 Tax=Pseudomassariella vexata TaxID=1141098 RepID=A0A1Y2E1L2_9PEZI|nr:uncharacterized protein BCR38DRAFT_409133 [Pseudomassariella vexata]ORY65438.1 hypothetical protein BCR38DRAFT_409133 [Pseudomassariella vexata]